MAPNCSDCHVFIPLLKERSNALVLVSHVLDSIICMPMQVKNRKQVNGKRIETSSGWAPQFMLKATV